MDYPAGALPPTQRFVGGGVYTLYYRGGFPAYTDMDANEPIYVGKADLPGKRQGRYAAKQATPTLYRRLKEHSETIQCAENLQLDDFKCRWLVLDPVWISLTEQVLIAKYRPIWNVIIDGFGNHDPGSGRYNQRRSQWDTLHPGRPWAKRLRDNPGTSADIAETVSIQRKKLQ